MKNLVTAVGLLGLSAAAAASLWKASQSDLFVIRVIEFLDFPDQTPITSTEIEKLARVPVGKVSLFSLNLEPIESRILSSPWVRRVELIKRFPQTLAIRVFFKDPKGLILNPQGKLVYLDEKGSPFGQLNARWKADLPLMAGSLQAAAFPGLFFSTVAPLFDQILVRSGAKLSELNWDPELGLRALVRYAPKQSAWVEFGETAWDSDLVESQLRHLDLTLQEMARRGILATSIWADSPKKIVVKTTRGS